MRRVWRKPKARWAWTTHQVRTWSRLVSAHDPGLARPCRSRCPASPGPAGAEKGGNVDEEVRLSVAELRRLLPALRESEEQREQRLWWSRFRRRHQAGAQRGRCRPSRPTGPASPTARAASPASASLAGVDTATLGTDLLCYRGPGSVGRASDHRLMVEGILWVMRTGGSWPSLARPIWSLVDGGRVLSSLAP